MIEIFFLETFFRFDGCQYDFFDCWRKSCKKGRVEVSKEGEVRQGKRGEELVLNSDEFIYNKLARSLYSY